MMRLIITVIVALYLGGCSTATSIQKTDKSSSGFDGAIYKGEKSIVTEGMPESETYRIFHQAASGFISVNTIRVSAMQRANEFCAQKNKKMQVVSEHTSKPPHVLGNFPRVELIFTCVEIADSLPSSSENDKYSQLRQLKLLLDDGVITEEEFEIEKKKILAK